MYSNIQVSTDTEHDGTIDGGLNNVPGELKQLPQWCLWKAETRDGKLTKIPYAATGEHAKANDPETWVTYEDASAALEADSDFYAGLGFVFASGGGIVGVDLDNCIDANGQLKPWAEDILRKLNSYAEVSPSGKGVKVFCHGSLPTKQTGTRRKYHGGMVETYQHGRYFTVTGQSVSGYPSELRECTPELQTLWTQICPPTTAVGIPPKLLSVVPEGDDDALLRHAYAAANGHKIQKLMEGEYDHTSQSEADLALCSHLAFWTNGDAARIDRIFRTSSLLRPKWDEARGLEGQTYGSMTIAKALADSEGPSTALDSQQQVDAARQVVDDFLASDMTSKQFPKAVFDNDSVLDALTLLIVHDRRSYDRSIVNLQGRGCRKKDLDRLERCVKDAAAKYPTSTQATVPDAQYLETPLGIVWNKNLPNGEVSPVPVTNFLAKIVEDVHEDDGSDEARRAFTVEARIGEQANTVKVAAEDFEDMEWPIQKLGATAIIHAGAGIRDRARAAIQSLSTDIRQRTIYKHLGWREINGTRCYLHSGGAIGPNGPISDIDMGISGELARYLLPDPPPEDELRNCIRKTLEIRKLTRPHITCCLEGTIFRAPLGVCDTTVFLAGRTGTGKSELAAQYQRHYGAEMARTALPANWLSTGNSLEAAMFLAKDAVLTIDDFNPQGSIYDVARIHQLADRVIRSHRNKSGRQRLWANGERRITKTPQGVLVITGEDIPRGNSLRAGMMILELEAGDVDFKLLTEVQRHASNGVYARTMAGYIQWLARQYDEVHGEVPTLLSMYRDQAASSSHHARTPELVSNLFIGVVYFLRFAADVGAISKQEADTLQQEAWEALGQAAAQQKEHLVAAEPEQMFVERIRAALVSGAAHITSVFGEWPNFKQPGVDAYLVRALGWEHVDSVWQAKGKTIGWIDGDNLYLEPTIAFDVAQDVGRHDQRIPVESKTLHKRLADAGLLASTDRSRGHIPVRRTIEERRMRVLHFRLDTIIGCRESYQSTHSARPAE